MPGGGGGRGLKVYVGGPSRNNGSGGLTIPLSSAVTEYWVRLYMKYPLGMRSTIGGENWGHKILWMDGPDNQAIILEPDPSGIKVWNQGQGASGVVDGNWSWNQIWGHSTFGSNLPADGQWHLWEMYVKHDTGSNDGIETVWIDNVRRFHFTGLDINTQGTDAIKIHTNQAGVEGGSCVPIYFDDIAVSATGRIGPLGGTTYEVTPSAGANGSISPATPQTVNSGGTAAFTVTPAAGYTASVGGTCGGSLVGTTYTTGAITANCTVSATFACKKLATPTGLNVASFVANPPSNITLTYGWSPVTTHQDGSALNSDLANYRLYWGTTSGGSYNTASTGSGIVSVAVGPTQTDTLYYAKIGAESALNAVCNSDLSAEISYFAEIPPALSNLLPTTNFSRTATTATLQATTDKTATCRYAPGSGTPYAGMTPFSNTVSTAHSSVVPVVAGGIYQYCFRCQGISAISGESCTRFAVDPNPKKRVRH